MRALTVLTFAAPLALIPAPAAAQSVIQGGRWVTPAPAPAPAPTPPPQAAEPSVEPAAPPIVSTPVVPEARLNPPQTGPAPVFAPRQEVVQPLPQPATPAAPAPVRRAETPAPAIPAPAPAPAVRAEAPPPPASAPPGATYPAPVVRAEAPPPPPRVEAPPRPVAVHASRRGHHQRPQRWGEMREGRWEGGWRAPGGWQAYRPPSEGWRLPDYWFAPEFEVVDYWTYDLAEPFPDYRWVRYYDDAVLVDPDGRVHDWVANVDWNGGYRYADGAWDTPAYPAERVPAYRDEDVEIYVDRGERVLHVDDGYGPPPPPYPEGGYIADGYYYPPAVTTTVVIHSEPVETSKTHVTEEVVRRGARGKGKRAYR